MTPLTEAVERFELRATFRTFPPHCPDLELLQKHCQQCSQQCTTNTQSGFKPTVFAKLFTIYKRSLHKL